MLWEGIWVLHGVKQGITGEPGLWFALQNTLEGLRWDEQLYSWCFVDMKGGIGTKHCFLGGGSRKVPFTTLGKAVRSYGKMALQSTILTSLTSCWVPRVLFRREGGKGRRGNQEPVMEYEASGETVQRVPTVAAGAGPCHVGD